MSNNQIISIDNQEVAQSVVKSLRSSCNSSRFYKQNASRDDFLIPDLEKFNEIVMDQSRTQIAVAKTQTQINSIIDNFKPPPFVSNEDNDSSDEEDNKNVKSSLRIIDNASPKSIPSPKKSPKYDFEAEEFDDDEDNDELFRDFVAPKSVKKSDNRQSLNDNSNDGEVKYIRGIQDLIQNANSDKSYVKYISKSNSTQSKYNSNNNNSGSTSIVSSSSKNNGNNNRNTPNGHFNSPATSSSRIAIKPGQTIRVKAPSKFSKQQQHQQQQYHSNSSIADNKSSVISDDDDS